MDMQAVQHDLEALLRQDPATRGRIRPRVVEVLIRHLESDHFLDRVDVVAYGRAEAELTGLHVETRVDERRIALDVGQTN